MKKAGLYAGMIVLVLLLNGCKEQGNESKQGVIGTAGAAKTNKGRKPKRMTEKGKLCILPIIIYLIFIVKLKNGQAIEGIRYIQVPVSGKAQRIAGEIAVFFLITYRESKFPR